MADKVFIDPIGYKAKRTPDTQYRTIIKDILDTGETQETQLVITDDSGTERNASARFKEVVVMDFDLTNGIPLITERNIHKAAFGAIAELIAFMNGAHTLEQLDEYGVPRIWWEPQITPEKTAKRGLEPGDLGPGSYGPAYHDFPTAAGTGFNQVKAIVDQIRYKPHLRTHVMTSFIPQLSFRGPGYDQKVVVVPCHGSFLHFRVHNGELTLKHVQRSGDMPVGVQFNMVQYSALAIMVAQATGTKAKRYIHVVSDAHMYENQFESVELFLSREPYAFPKMLINESVPIDEEYKKETGIELPDIFAYRPDDFQFEEYEAHPGFRTPTAA